jgi:hypothetical protein
MARTGQEIAAISMHGSRRAHLRAGLSLVAGALALGGCYVVPARTAYVAPAPVVVAPAPVVVAPAPVYYCCGYGWHRRGRW